MLIILILSDFIISCSSNFYNFLQFRPVYRIPNTCSSPPEHFTTRKSFLIKHHHFLVIWRNHLNFYLWCWVELEDLLRRWQCRTQETGKIAGDENQKFKEIWNGDLLWICSLIRFVNWQRRWTDQLICGWTESHCQTYENKVYTANLNPFSLERFKVRINHAQSTINEGEAPCLCGYWVIKGISVGRKGANKA